MSFCGNCGSPVVDGAKYCHACGAAINVLSNDNNERKQEYEGKIKKCPNCGGVVPSFQEKCPTCGMELRGVNASSAIQEFARKLQQVDAEEKIRLLSSFGKNQKRREKKLELISSFPIPNTKEDLLEFMILATSNFDPSVYNSTRTSIVDERKRAISDAWLAKIKQVYSKAHLIQGDSAFQAQIDKLYNECQRSIKKAKWKGILLWPLLLFAPFIFLTILWGGFDIAGNHKQKVTSKNEEPRLEAIVDEAEDALAEGDFRLALRIAESMDYNGYDDDRERWWGIKKETLIDMIIEEAEADGIHLDRTPEETAVPDNEINDIVTFDEDESTDDVDPLDTTSTTDDDIQTDTPDNKSIDDIEEEYAKTMDDIEEEYDKILQIIDSIG